MPYEAKRKREQGMMEKFQTRWDFGLVQAWFGRALRLEPVWSFGLDEYICMYIHTYVLRTVHICSVLDSAYLFPRRQWAP